MPNYGIAKVDRKWLLTQGVDTLLTGTNEHDMREVRQLISIRHNDRTPESIVLASRYTKIVSGRRSWLAKQAVGADYTKGVAFGHETAVDEVLTQMGRIEVIA